MYNSFEEITGLYASNKTIEYTSSESVTSSYDYGATVMRRTGRGHQMGASVGSGHGSTSKGATSATTWYKTGGSRSSFSQSEKRTTKMEIAVNGFPEGFNWDGTPETINRQGPIFEAGYTFQASGEKVEDKKGSTRKAWQSISQIRKESQSNGYNDVTPTNIYEGNGSETVYQTEWGTETLTIGWSTSKVDTGGCTTEKRTDGWMNWNTDSIEFTSFKGGVGKEKTRVTTTRNSVKMSSMDSGNQTTQGYTSEGASSLVVYPLTEVGTRPYGSAWAYNTIITVLPHPALGKATYCMPLQDEYSTLEAGFTEAFISATGVSILEGFHSTFDDSFRIKVRSPDFTTLEPKEVVSLENTYGNLRDYGVPNWETNSKLERPEISDTPTARCVGNYKRFRAGTRMLSNGNAAASYTFRRIGERCREEKYNIAVFANSLGESDKTSKTSKFNENLRVSGTISALSMSTESTCEKGYTLVTHSHLDFALPPASVNVRMSDGRLLSPWGTEQVSVSTKSWNENDSEWDYVKFRGDEANYDFEFNSTTQLNVLSAAIGTALLRKDDADQSLATIMGSYNLTTTEKSLGYYGSTQLTTTTNGFYGDERLTEYWSRYSQLEKYIPVFSVTYRWQNADNDDGWQELDIGGKKNSIYTGHLESMSCTERGANHLIKSTYSSASSKNSSSYEQTGSYLSYIEFNGPQADAPPPRTVQYTNRFEGSFSSSKEIETPMLSYTYGKVVKAFMREANPFMLYNIKGTNGYMRDSTDVGSSDTRRYDFLTWDGMGNEDIGFHRSSPTIDWVHWQVTQDSGATYNQNGKTETISETLTIYPPIDIESGGEGYPAPTVYKDEVFSIWDIEGGYLPASVATRIGKSGEPPLIFPEPNEVQLTFTDDCAQTWTWDTGEFRWCNSDGCEGDEIADPMMGGGGFDIDGNPIVDNVSYNEMCANLSATYGGFITSPDNSETELYTYEGVVAEMHQNTGASQKWWYANCFHGTEISHGFFGIGVPFNSYDPDHNARYSAVLCGSSGVVKPTPIVLFQPKTFFKGAMGYTTQGGASGITETSTGHFQDTYLHPVFKKSQGFMEEWYAKTKCIVYYDTEKETWLMSKQWRSVKEVKSNQDGDYVKAVLESYQTETKQLEMDQLGMGTTWQNFGMKPMVAGNSNYAVINQMPDVGYSDPIRTGAVRYDSVIKASNIQQGNKSYGYRTYDCDKGSRAVFLAGNIDQVLGTISPNEHEEFNSLHGGHYNTHWVNKFGWNNETSEADWQVMYKQSFIPMSKGVDATVRKCVTSVETQNIQVDGVPKQVQAGHNAHMVFGRYAQFWAYNDGVFLVQEFTHDDASFDLTLQWGINNLQEISMASRHQLSLLGVGENYRITHKEP